MSQDDKVIGYLTQAGVLGLMRETGMIALQDTASAEGKPVIHALLKVVNAETGAELPGGLPFSVVMFKAAAEEGYSNIAIGTVVPAAELGIVLPANFFNLCNERFRFIRAFPIDAGAFVLQMDLFVRNATREYVKFGFGLWAALFGQVLFELMGRSSKGVNRAAEVYGAVQSNIDQRFAEAIGGLPPAEEPLPEIVLEPVVSELETAGEPVDAATTEPEEAVPPVDAATTEPEITAPPVGAEKIEPEKAAEPQAERSAEPAAEGDDGVKAPSEAAPAPETKAAADADSNEDASEAPDAVKSGDEAEKSADEAEPKPEQPVPVLGAAPEPLVPA